MVAVLDGKKRFYDSEATYWPELFDEADYYVIRIPLISREGHELLTRRAAAGLRGVSSADLRALIKGVRRVDIGVRTHLSSRHQRRHALRARLCQPLRDARRDIRGHLALLHRRALAARSRRRTFEWIGEALHLIQDSYSEAHMARRRGRRGRHPIVYIRFFGLQGRGYPLEHKAPRRDPRDEVTSVRGWARVAMMASREFLRMILLHLRRRRSTARNRAELRAFMRKHFLLSARRREPSSIYRRCRFWPWRS